MFTLVWDNLYTDTTESTAVASDCSQPVRLDGAAYVSFEATCLSLSVSGTGTPTLIVRLEKSADLQTWRTVTAGVSISGAGVRVSSSGSSQITDAEYVRLRITTSASGTATVTAVFTAAIVVNALG